MPAFKRIGMEEKEAIEALFLHVFSAEPWNDDWSDREQLEGYIRDLAGQASSLTYGLYEDGALSSAWPWGTSSTGFPERSTASTSCASLRKNRGRASERRF